MAFLEYNDIAEDYASTRLPVGMDVVMHALASERPLKDQVLLDAGCGSGNYMVELVQEVRAIHGIDTSAAMIRLADQRLGDHWNVRLVRSDLLALPYHDGSFDSAICHFVLHHLSTATGCARATAAALRELHRVLVPGGTLLIQTASHEQIRDGYWWADLIPAAIARTKACYLTQEQLLKALLKAGFATPRSHVDLDSILQGADYLNPRGPLVPSYRAGDSAWSKATPDELETAQRRTRAMLESGKMACFLRERERIRRETGQYTFVFARKP